MEKIPVNNSPYQEMTLDFNDEKIRLTIRYNAMASLWFMDVYSVTADSLIESAVPLLVGVPLLWRNTAGYFFEVVDESGLMVSPFGVNDLGTRCFLYIHSKVDVVL
jgi:hypothetical protein